MRRKFPTVAVSCAINSKLLAHTFTVSHVRFFRVSLNFSVCCRGFIEPTERLAAHACMQSAVYCIPNILVTQVQHSASCVCLLVCRSVRTTLELNNLWPRPRYLACWVKFAGGDSRLMQLLVNGNEAGKPVMAQFTNTQVVTDTAVYGKGIRCANY